MLEIATIAAAALAVGLVLFGAYRVKRLFDRRRKLRQSQTLKPSSQMHLTRFRAINPDFFQTPEMRERSADITARGIRELDKGPRAPRRGEPAPDFSLLPLDPEASASPGARPLGAGTPVRLSDFKGHQPVVLIFGSYT